MDDLSDNTTGSPQDISLRHVRSSSLFINPTGDKISTFLRLEVSEFSHEAGRNVCHHWRQVIKIYSHHLHDMHVRFSQSWSLKQSLNILASGKNITSGLEEAPWRLTLFSKKNKRPPEMHAIGEKCAMLRIGVRQWSNQIIFIADDILYM